MELNLSSNLIRSSYDDTNFWHKLLLTDTQVSKIRKAFANNSSASISFSKTHLSKIAQLGWFVFDLPDVFNLPAKGLISIVNSLAKESKKTGAKKLNKDIFVDPGFNITVKKNKKRILSITVQE